MVKNHLSTGGSNATIDGGVVVAVPAGENFSSDATPILSANPQNFSWSFLFYMVNSPWLQIFLACMLLVVQPKVEVKALFLKTLKKWNFTL